MRRSPCQLYPATTARCVTRRRQRTDRRGGRFWLRFLNLTDIGVCGNCATTNTPHWAALIGYIGQNPPAAGSYTSTSVLPDAEKVFLVGSSYSGSAPYTGTLWLNFNDDAYSNATWDNSGSVQASVSVSPLLPTEPAPPNTTLNNPPINSANGGDPVNTYTGNYSYTHVDLAIPGRGPSPSFSRTYNSDDTRVTPLGPGWTSSYFVRLRAPSVGGSAVVAVGPQGRSDVYAVGSTTAFVAPPAVYTTLVANGDGNWTMTDKDQTTKTFDSQGRLTKMRDRYGNESDLTYDASGNLISVSDPAGRGALTFGYDGNGRLTSVSDWLSPPRVVRFDYDPNGRLWHVTDRNGQVTTYGYDGTTSHLTTITDANGHVAITNTYDSNGRVASQEDALGVTTGQQTTFSYVRDGFGNGTTTITYPPESYDGGSPVVTDTYDSQGRLTQRVTQPAKSTQVTITQSYSYDANSNLSSTPTTATTTA